jgi:hypothetical protein
MDDADESADVMLQALVASLQGASDVNAQYGRIDEWAAAGEVATLARLAGLLRVRAASASRQEWGFDETLRHLEEVLALTPGIAFADTLVRLSVGAALGDSHVEGSSAPSKRLLTHASMLAFAQQGPVLEELFERHADDARYDDLFAALAQEMTLHGVACAQMPAVVERWTALRRREHPLTWLPLALTRLETDLPLPAYFARGSSYPLPFAPFEREPD